KQLYTLNVRADDSATPFIRSVRSSDRSIVIRAVEPPPQGIDVEHPDPLQLSAVSQTVVMSVKLTGAPVGSGNGDGTGGVTLALTSADTNDVVIEPANLIFTRNNWQTAQKATVKLAGTAIDTKSERSVNVNVAVGNAAGTDNYGSVPAVAVAVVLDLTNRAPVFPEFVTSNFDEGFYPADHLIGSPIEATDEDNDGSDLRYERVGPSSLFGVTSAGQISLLMDTDFDFETRQSYQVTVRVHDGEPEAMRGHATVAVRVDLFDVDEPPVFSGDQRKRVAIIGMARKMTLVTATELDAGDALASYAIASKPSWITHDSTDSWKIDLNPPTSARGLHKLTIVATDNGSNSAERVLTLDVIPDLSINSWKLEDGSVAFDIANDSCASWTRFGAPTTGSGPLGGVLRIGVGVTSSGLAAVNPQTCGRTVDGAPYGGGSGSFNFKFDSARMVYESKAALELGTHAYVFHQGIQEADPTGGSSHPIIASKEYQVTYELANATVTVAETVGALVAANTKIATLTLDNAVADAQWSIVGTPAVAVGLAAVSGSETTEGALSLTAAAAMDFEAGANFLTLTVEAATRTPGSGATVLLRQALVEWKIELGNVDEQPAFAADTFPDQKVFADAGGSFTFHAATDPEGAQVTYRAVLDAGDNALPGWITFDRDPASDTFRTFTVAGSQYRGITVRIKVIATDGTTTAISQSFQLVVESGTIDTDEAGKSALTADSKTTVISLQLGLQPAAKPVTLTIISANPDHVEVDPATMVFSTTNWDDWQELTLTLTDAGAAFEGERSVRITVAVHNKRNSDSRYRRVANKRLMVTLNVPYAGLALYTANCAGCHGANGNTNPSYNLNPIPSSSDIYSGGPDAAITVLLLGRNGTMPSFATQSNANLASILNYVYGAWNSGRGGPVTEAKVKQQRDDNAFVASSLIASLAEGSKTRGTAIGDVNLTANRVGTQFTAAAVFSIQPGADADGFGIKAGTGEITLAADKVFDADGADPKTKFTLNIRVSEASKESVDGKFVLSITPVDEPPVFASELADRRLVTNQERTFTAPVAVDPESPDSTVTYSASLINPNQTLPHGGLSFNASSRQFTVAAGAASSVLTVRLVAADTNNKQSVQTFELELSQAGIDIDRPDPLELSLESQQVVMSVQLIGAPTGAGNGGVTLGLSTNKAADIAIDPANLAFTRSNWQSAQTVTVKLKPAALNTRDERNFEVRIGVSDAAGTGNYASGVPTVTIAAAIDLTNRVPVIPALSTRLAVAGQENKLVLKAATDPEGDAITYALTNQPDWITGVEAGTNITLTTATSIARGTYMVTVAATDSEGGTANREFRLLVVEDYGLLDWNTSRHDISFTFNADICSAVRTLGEVIDFRIEDASSNRSIGTQFNASQCARRTRGTETVNIYGFRGTGFEYDLNGRRLGALITTPPNSFDYEIKVHSDYNTELGQDQVFVDKTYQLDYNVRRISGSIAEGVHAANTALLTITLASAVSNPVWTVAESSGRAVAVTPVPGKETTEAVVALSAVQTVTYNPQALRNEFARRLFILTRQTDRTAISQKAVEARLDIRVRDVGDFQVDTTNAPALASDGTVAVFSFTGTGCSATATYELDIPGSGMAKQTGQYCKSAATDLSTDLPDGLAFSAAADSSLSLRITLSEFSGLAGKRITVRIHNIHSGSRTGGSADAVLVPSVYVVYRDENVGKATAGNAANTGIITLSATGGASPRYM
ncbi:MAG: putative Ig domain-containing protein, partial [Betaproteobacteria bacterium]|nr:putative Ig domain-containing protein [Betaproteobacteria bacterium]